MLGGLSIGCGLGRGRQLGLNANAYRQYLIENIAARDRDISESELRLMSTEELYSRLMRVLVGQRKSREE